MGSPPTDGADLIGGWESGRILFVFSGLGLRVDSSRKNGMMIPAKRNRRREEEKERLTLQHAGYSRKLVAVQLDDPDVGSQFLRRLRQERRHELARPAPRGVHVEQQRRAARGGRRVRRVHVGRRRPGCDAPVHVRYRPTKLPDQCILVDVRYRAGYQHAGTTEIQPPDEALLHRRAQGLDHLLLLDHGPPSDFHLRQLLLELPDAQVPEFREGGCPVEFDGGGGRGTYRRRRIRRGSRSGLEGGSRGGPLPLPPLRSSRRRRRTADGRSRRTRRRRRRRHHRRTVPGLREPPLQTVAIEAIGVRHAPTLQFRLDVAQFHIGGTGRRRRGDTDAARWRRRLLLLGGGGRRLLFLLGGAEATIR